MSPSELLKGARIGTRGGVVVVTLPPPFEPVELAPAEAAALGVDLIGASYQAGRRWWHSGGAQASRDALSTLVGRFVLGRLGL